MKNDEVIKALCGLVTFVGRDRFKDKLAYDCFCSLESTKPLIRGEVHPEIVSYIINATMEKIGREINEGKI